MTDISLIAAAIGGIRQSLELLKTIYEVSQSTDVILKTATITAQLAEALRQLALAEAERLACIRRTGDLEEEVARLRKFDAEKDRYRLVEWSPGTVVYALRPECQGSEPPYCLCPACYQQAIPAPLQFQRYRDGRAVHQCPLCKFEYVGPRAPDADDGFTPGPDSGPRGLW